MKICFLFLSALMCFSLVTDIYSAEYSYSGESLSDNVASEEWGELIDALPDELSGEIVGIDPYDPQSAVESVKEKTAVGYWLGKLWDELCRSLSKLFPDVLPVFSTVLLLSAAKIILAGSSNELSEDFLMLGRLALAISLFRTTFDMLEVAQSYLTTICGVMNLLTPIMQMIYLAEGSLTQLSVSATSVMLAVTAVAYVNTNVMAPCTSILFTLSSVSTVCSDVKMGGLTASIRQLIMRIWQIMTIMFSFMLGTQSIIARSADNLAAKTVKFALGSLIPMAGGVMAEAYNTVKEGLSFVKTTAGVGGIIIILLLLIPGIVPLVVYKLSVILLSAVADILKLDGAAELFEEVKGIIEIITAVVLYTSLMLVFALILFTKSQVG